MSIRTFHIIFLLTIGLLNNTLQAQQSVQIEIEDSQNNINHNGSFTYALVPAAVVKFQNGIHHIDFSGRNGASIISIYVNDLIWESNDDTNNSLVISRSWFTESSNTLTPLIPCVEIQPGTSAPIEVKVTKNGSGILRVKYAIKKPNQSCQYMVPTNSNSGSFYVKFKVTGFPSEEEETSSLEESASTDTEPAIPIEEQTLWKECVDQLSSISCMKKYLLRYPKGAYAETAIGRSNYYATNIHFPNIKKTIRPGNEKETIKECEKFLDLFPRQVVHYKEVEDILRDAKSPVVVTPQVKETPPPVLEETTTINRLPDPTSPKETEPTQPETPQEAKPIPKPQDQIAWEEAKDINTCDAYNTYINGESKQQKKYLAIAYQKRAEHCKITKENVPKKGVNQYSFIIHNVFDLVVDSIVPPIDEKAIIRKKPGSPFEYIYTLELNFPDDKKYIVYFSDPGHPDKTITRHDSIPLDNLLDPHINIVGDSIQFSFKKGTEPFNIYFRLKEGRIVYQTKTKNKEFTIKKSFLKKEKNFSGEYIIEVADKVLDAPFTKAPDDKNWTVNIEQDLWQWYYSIPIAVLLIFFISSLRNNYLSKKRNKKKLELENFMGSRNQSLAHLHKKKIDDSIPEQEMKNQVSIENNSPVSNPASPTEKTSGIKIKGLRKSSKKVIRYEEESEIESLIQEGIFAFQPSRHWDDSAIECVYFSRKSIISLDHFLVSQNLKPLQEKEGTIPEIGGILMGKPYLSSQDNKFRIIIEEFVPISPEFHNVFKLEFSTQSLVKDLGDIQDRYPTYTAVGWFHTHPGHGLFLSKPDLTIQEQFFGEPYQFAMEIDSLTKRLDTAFFTRTMDGRINNTAQKSGDTPWFSWLENVESFDRS